MGAVTTTFGHWTEPLSSDLRGDSALEFRLANQPPGHIMVGTWSVLELVEKRARVPAHYRVVVVLALMVERPEVAKLVHTALLPDWHWMSSLANSKMAIAAELCSRMTCHY